MVTSLLDAGAARFGDGARGVRDHLEVAVRVDERHGRQAGAGADREVTPAPQPSVSSRGNSDGPVDDPGLGERRPRRLVQQQVGVVVRLPDAAQDLHRRDRNDRVHGQRHQAQTGGQAVEDRVQTGSLRLVLGELPGRFLFDELVEAPHEFPDRVEGRGDVEVGVLLRRLRDHRLALGRDRGQSLTLRSSLRDGSVAVLADHADRAADEVAQLVGELVVVARPQTLEADVAVLAERHLAHEVVPQRLGADFFDDREGIEDVAAGLAHLLAADEQVAVDELAGGQVVAGAHEQGRPDDRVELEDVLGEEVERRPVARREVLARARVRERREVVDERVDPDVDDLLVVPRHGDAPGDAGAADADVLEPLLDERQRLVVARPGLHEAGGRAEELGQPVLVLAEQEVVVLLLQPDRLDAVVRTEAVGREVALVPEGLAGGAVEAAVAALLDVAGGLELLDEALHERLVLRVGGADEEVVGGAEGRGQLAVARRQLVHVLLRGEPALLRRLGDLGAVLVGAGEEEDVLAPLAVVARQYVRGHGRVGVAVVRLAVHVVDGRGDVEAHRR